MIHDDQGKASLVTLSVDYLDILNTAIIPKCSRFVYQQCPLITGHCVYLLLASLAFDKAVSYSKLES